MPAIASYSLTGNSYIDGVLGDYKWAAGSLTYSFPLNGLLYGLNYGSGENLTNFGAFNTAQQAATRQVLKMFSSVANLQFVEIAETSVQHADLRFGMSDKPGTAWAYFPSTSGEGGDAWFNNSSGSYAKPAKGNYAYLTFLHEIGHSLGLEHAHEHNIMPLDRDSMEYAVMSYRSYMGASTSSGYVNETWGYAQSLMMYDIAALQHMYGANYSTNSSNTTYTWSATTGESFINGVGQGAPGGNKVFLTVWDGGGVDTYDFANYSTSLKIDLRPGEWTITSASQLAKLRWDGSKVAAGNVANALLQKGDVRSLIENANGGAGNDTITGNQTANLLRGNGGNDVLNGAAGDDILDGGAGSDTAVYGGARSSYNVTTLSNGSIQITDLRSGGSDGKDAVSGIEWFQFADKVYAAGDLGLNSTTLVQPVVQNTAAPPNLTLTGTSSSNKLYGGAGNDKLYGKAGNDLLKGGAGKDIFVGSTGKDVMYGGTGADVFDFDSIKESRGSSVDTIKDFQRGTDRIDLRGIDANTKSSGNQAFIFIGKSDFTGKAGQLKFVGGVVSGDVNGDKIADFQIKVSNLSTLSKSDFYL